MTTNGKCIIVSAPSGAGKTTIVKHLMGQGLKLEFSVSACSRPPREQESHGIDYYFLDKAGFIEKIENDEFIEWQEVYSGYFYGTLKSEIVRIWNRGGHVIFDVDVFGGLNLKKVFGDAALSVFIMPPSEQALAERLRKRGSESGQSLAQRLDKARLEIAQSRFFDRIIVNNDLEIALAEATREVRLFLGTSEARLDLNFEA